MIEAARFVASLVVVAAAAATVSVASLASAETVVKPDEFWDRLGFSGTVRATFEGSYSGAPDKTFKIYYFATQVAFSDACTPHLSENANRRGYTQESSFMDGTPNVETFYYFVDPPFTARFDEYAPMAFREIEKIADVLNPDNPTDQIKRFIKATGCESAAVHQLRQNFLRAANRSRSLQTDGIDVPGAASESATQAETSMYGACMSRPYAEKPYCLCFEKEAKSRMTTEEYEHFKADFSLYFVEVQRPIEVDSPMPPAGDRRWQLYEIKRQCAR